MSLFLELLGFSNNILIFFLLISPQSDPHLPPLRIPIREKKCWICSDGAVETAVTGEIVEISGNLETTLKKKID